MVRGVYPSAQTGPCGMGGHHGGYSTPGYGGRCTLVDVHPSLLCPPTTPWVHHAHTSHLGLAHPAAQCGRPHSDEALGSRLEYPMGERGKRASGPSKVWEVLGTMVRRLLAPPCEEWMKDWIVSG